MNRITSTIGLLLLPAIALQGQAAQRRPLSLDDASRVRDVTDPAISPDGAWVAYVVTSENLKDDRNDSDIWMASWDGTRNIRLTWRKESEHSPRWSPDGRYLAFLSGRDDAREEDQLWLLDRAGGEAEPVTSFPGGINDYAWSPDGKRLALVVADSESDSTAGADSAKKIPKPIVIDRYQFKKDEVGYLGKPREHLYLFDVERRTAEPLTPDRYDETLPAFSPDGKSIAFVTRHGADPDRSDNWDIYVIDAAPGATARQLTTYEGDDNDPAWGSRPEWSPDGRSIAYLRGGPQKLIYYAVQKLAVVAAAGGAERVVAPELDRWSLQPHWSADGSAIVFLLEDDRNYHVAKVAAAGGKVERILGGRRVVSGLTVGPNGRTAVVASTPLEPQELFALETDGSLRPLSRQNDRWLSEVQLGAVDEISFKSRDGTPIGGFLVKPPDYQPGNRYPAILRIHGGPVEQLQNEFDFEWQILASQGYVVIAANPRGSSGRGEKFSTAIYADWGNKDAQDVLAAVDYGVARGIADPERLGVGGWSYGGMLTNYTIAQDRRFKAAVSGAGISNILAGFGTDQYIREYEAELGPPWVDTRTWLKISFPFLHADRIVTPTLFLCGDKDFNVPLQNSEQMYQALRSLGRETELIIYPGEYHGIRRPSFRRDRLERYIAWYDRFLKAEAPTAKQSAPAAAGK